MTWLIHMLFPSTRQSVRISPNHLPGLRAPKAAPKVPHLAPTPEQKQPVIEQQYERFRASRGSQPTQRKKQDRGVGF